MSESWGAHQFILNRWEELWKRIDPTLSDDWVWRQYNYLMWLYDDPRRRYHTADYLWECLIEFEKIGSHFDAEVADAYSLALFYHNAVYDVRSDKNEVNSAALASLLYQEIGLGDSEFSATVHEAILATQFHRLTADKNLQLFLDITQAVLGKDWEVYYQYKTALRLEYDHLSEGEYARTRSRYLRNLLDTGRWVYQSKFYHGQCKVRAQDNMRRELVELEAVPWR